MRGNLEASEYKHVVLGLVFLKYISDAFEQRHTFLERATTDPGSDYFIPDPLGVTSCPSRVMSTRRKQCSGCLRRRAGHSSSPRRSSPRSASSSMRRWTPSNAKTRPLKASCRTYARADIDKRLLGELVDLIGSIGFTHVDHGSDDVLGRVYEYFLGKFAKLEGREGAGRSTRLGPLFASSSRCSAVQGRVYDPCCGSGGMFVQSAEFVAAHGGTTSTSPSMARNSTATTWRLGQDEPRHPRDRGESRRPRGGQLPSQISTPTSVRTSSWRIPHSTWTTGSRGTADDPRWKYGVPRLATATSPGFNTSSATSPRTASPGSFLQTGACRPIPGEKETYGAG